MIRVWVWSPESGCTVDSGLEGWEAGVSRSAREPTGKLKQRRLGQEKVMGAGAGHGQQGRENSMRSEDCLQLFILEDLHPAGKLEKQLATTVSTWIQQSLPCSSFAFAQ